MGRNPTLAQNELVPLRVGPGPLFSSPALRIAPSSSSFSLEVVGKAFTTEDPAVFRRVLLKYVFEYEIPYEFVASEFFETLCRKADEHFFQNVSLPQGGWITRDWLLDAYHEVRICLPASLLSKGDKLTRDWIVQRREEDGEEEEEEEEDEDYELGEADYRIQ
ncbi:hypothetical protein F5Y11DRAFT_348161 [Daldinia sp. FL1419]|nr:hypothetical protein F5Y11DRAFT_348161 [Daldinia sp. FL1419]